MPFSLRSGELHGGIDSPFSRNAQSGLSQTGSFFLSMTRHHAARGLEDPFAVFTCQNVVLARSKSRPPALPSGRAAASSRLRGRVDDEVEARW